jgi:hypothetical protein
MNHEIKSGETEMAQNVENQDDQKPVPTSGDGSGRKSRDNSRTDLRGTLQSDSIHQDVEINSSDAGVSDKGASSGIDSGLSSQGLEINEVTGISSISEMLRSKLIPDVNIVEVYVEYDSLDREYNLYAVIDEENLDDRLNIMGHIRSVAKLHPDWSISGSIIVEETDPALDQIPDSAKLLSELISRPGRREAGYAF